jgi:phospholipase C
MSDGSRGGARHFALAGGARLETFFAAMRVAATAAFAAVCALSAACGSSPRAAVSGDPDATVGPGAADAPVSTPIDASPPDATPLPPDAAPIRIKHIVVVVKENHTFDNYFGSFPGADGIDEIATMHGAIAPPHAPDRTPRDLCHEHACALTDWDGGTNMGWDMVSGSTQNGDDLAYAQYKEADIPNYWQYARHFVLADRFFANELGPSFPGHAFTLAAQIGWSTGNPNTNITHPYWGCDQSSTTRVTIQNQTTCQDEQVFPCFKIPSVPDVLPTGVDWKFYGSNFYILNEIWTMFNAIDGIRNGPGWSHVVNANTFDQDVDNGTLPAVSWLVNQDLSDEHPAVGGVCAGENWTVGHINHLMQSPLWADTAILFTMDDFGGWYDHVPPPRQYGCDPQHPYGLGFRLPLLIISPYAKPGFVFHEQAEQASIPRFIERVFDTDTLSSIDPAAQDGQANDLMNAFDFAQAPLPPLVLQTRACL